MTDTPKKNLMINGVLYKVWVKDGIRYIDGKTVEEFLYDCDPLTLKALAAKGMYELKKAIGDENDQD